MRLNNKFAVSVALNGIINLSGLSTIIHIGPIDNDGLLSGSGGLNGIAVKINTSGVTLQVFDGSLYTETISISLFEGLRRIVLVWDGIDKLELYAAVDTNFPFEINNVTLIGTLTLPSPASSSYAGRALEITNMVTIDGTALRTLAIREVKALYTF
jgi:hypothetical protein